MAKNGIDARDFEAFERFPPASRNPTLSSSWD